MASIRESVQRQRKWTNKIKGNVYDAGGGVVGVYVDRDTAEYPRLGLDVTITWERPPTREEAVRQVIHDSLATGEARYLGLHVDISTPGYATAEGPIDPFTEIARRVLAALEEASD